MGRADAIGDILKGLGRLFFDPAPRFPRYRPPLRPGPDPDLDVPFPKPTPPRDPGLRPRPPYVPDTDTAEPETAPDPPPEAERETFPSSEPKQECETCPACAARDMGGPVTRPYSPNETAHINGYAYQHFVVPWFSHDPVAGTIGEWNFSGVDFDGLHPSECLLIEAKGNHDHLLTQDDWSPSGRPFRQPWATNAFARISKQSNSQHAAVVPHWPKVRLKWVFQTIMTKLYVAELFLQEGKVIIETEHRPFEQ
jgi:hypothetical protein